MTDKIEIMRDGRHWFIWTVPDHRIVSRSFVTHGEAQAELVRLLAAAERFVAFERSSRNHRDALSQE